MADPIKVLIVDDHQVVRRGLRTFLEVQDDIEVVGEAADGAEGVARTEELKPDVVLMDVKMPAWTASTPCADSANSTSPRAC